MKIIGLKLGTMVAVGVAIWNLLAETGTSQEASPKVTRERTTDTEYRTFTGSSPNPRAPAQNVSGSDSSTASAWDIATLLAILVETEGLPEPEPCTPPEYAKWIMAETRRRDEALQALSTSVDGCTALLDIFAARGQDTPGDVAGRIGACAPLLSPSPQLLDALTALPSLAFCHPEFSVESLKPKSVFEFSDVWHAWLRAVETGDIGPCPNPNLVVWMRTGQGTPAKIYRLLECACTALTVTCDPSGVEILRRVIASHPGMEIPNECNGYLAKIGDPADWYLVPSASLANERNAWVSFMAGVSIRPSGTLAWSSSYPFGKKRPDLQRGFLSSFVRNTSIRRAIIRAHENASFSSSPFESIETAGHTIPAAKIETMVEEAIDLKSWTLASAWLESLGRKKDLYDLQFLFRHAEQPGPAQGVSSREERGLKRVQSGALRAIARQLLISPDKTISYLNNVRGQERMAISRRTVVAIGSLPRISRAGPSCLVDSRPRVHRNQLASSITRHRTFVETHQEALLRWMPLTNDPFVLAPTYALMDSPEALARLTEWVRQGSSPAIESAWALRRQLPRDVLNNAFDHTDASTWDRMMVLLMLSEGGNREVYGSLSAELAESPPFPDPVFRDPIAIVLEAARREDWTLIAETVARLAAAGPELSRKDREVCDQIVKTGLARLLRSKPALVNETITRSLPPSALLSAIAEAHTQYSETMLKKLEPQLARDLESGSFPHENLWVESLRETGTRWCRDMLVRHLRRQSRYMSSNALHSLAWLGDTRVLDLCPPERIGDRQKCALLLGRIDEVPKKHPSNSPTTIFAKPIGAKTPYALPPPRAWPPGRLDAMLEELVKNLSTASPRRRLYLVSALRPEREFWPNELIATLLYDDFGPVRLSALLYVLKHPRPELASLIESIGRNDPYPWCRRVAREILIYEPDPLTPAEGLDFF